MSIDKREKRYILSDVLLNKGVDQVSSYLKQRKVLKYVKANLVDHFDWILYESKVLDSPEALVDKAFDAITTNNKITLIELFPDVIKDKKKRSYYAK